MQGFGSDHDGHDGELVDFGRESRLDYSHLNPPPRSEQEMLATGAFANPIDLAQRYRYRKTNFFLGQPLVHEPAYLGDHPEEDRHVGIFCGTRGGKGTRWIIPNLCHYPGSALVLDPAGENATVTASRRGPGSKDCEGMGQDVHVLDYTGIVRGNAKKFRSSFNPMDWLDPADPFIQAKAMRLVVALIPKKAGESHQDYWDQAGRRLLLLIILHVATDPEFEHRRTLATVASLIKAGDLQTHEDLIAAGVEDPGTPSEVLMVAMQTSKALNAVISEDAESFQQTFENAPRQWEGLRENAVNALRVLLLPEIAASMESSDFTFRDMKDNPSGMTVYAVLPLTYADGGFVVHRLLLEIFSSEMRDRQGRPKNEHPVLMVMDEFAGLQRMDVLETDIAEIAKHFVRMVIILQNIGQLQKVYKEGWEAFESGCGIKVFFSLTDSRSREHVSKYVGEQHLTLMLRSYQRAGSENQSRTLGESDSEAENWGEAKSTNRQRNWNAGISQSEQRNWNEGQSRSLQENWSEGEGENSQTNWNEGQAIGRGENWSKNTSRNRGTGRGGSTSSGRSWRPKFLGLFPFFNHETHNESRSLSANSYEGTQEGSGVGGNTSRTDNTSHGGSAGRSKTSSRGGAAGNTASSSQGGSAGNTVSLSRGGSEGETETSSRGGSRTHTDNQSQTRGFGRSETESIAESYHKRPLVEPSEFGWKFARQRRGHALYPGVALVIIEGERPVPAMTVNYFDPEHKQLFDRCFDPHPDHPMIRPRKRKEKILQAIPLEEPKPAKPTKPAEPKQKALPPPPAPKLMLGITPPHWFPRLEFLRRYKTATFLKEGESYEAGELTLEYSVNGFVLTAKAPWKMRYSRKGHIPNPDCKRRRESTGEECLTIGCCQKYAVLETDGGVDLAKASERVEKINTKLREKTHTLAWALYDLRKREDNKEEAEYDQKMFGLTVYPAIIAAVVFALLWFFCSDWKTAYALWSGFLMVGMVGLVVAFEPLDFETEFIIGFFLCLFGMAPIGLILWLTTIASDATERRERQRRRLKDFNNQLKAVQFEDICIYSVWEKK